MNRDQLIEGLTKAASIPPLPVEMPEWGGTVYVKPSTVEEVTARSHNAPASADLDPKTQVARGICKVLCDKDGNRVLDPDTEEDVAFLLKQDWSVIQRFLFESRKQNGEGHEGAEEAKND